MKSKGMLLALAVALLGCFAMASHADAARDPGRASPLIVVDQVPIEQALAAVDLVMLNPVQVAQAIAESNVGDLVHVEAMTIRSASAPAVAVARRCDITLRLKARTYASADVELQKAVVHRE